MEKSKPNLFIVGAAKSGTTSLHYYLSQHPKIFMSAVKEPNHFSDAKSENKLAYLPPEKNKAYVARYIKDPQLYLSLYDDAGDRPFKGEASASYLYDKTTAKRIYDFNADSRIIIMLREPVDRAFSHYKMNYNLGIEHEVDFLKAIANDEANDDKVWGGAPLYIDAGLYYEQIKRYTDLFPRENVYIIKFEDFIKDPVTHLKLVLNFLGLSFNDIPQLNIEPKNQGMLIRSNFMRYTLLRVRRSHFLKTIRSLLPIKVKSYLMSYFSRNGAKSAGPPERLSDELQKYLNETYFLENKKLLNKVYGVNWDDIK